jgi:CDP-glycerol glycerophosphotransferase
VCNYFGKGYGDNGKYIVEELLNEGLKCDIVWLLRKDLIRNSEFSSQVRTVKYGSILGLYELATAKVWIDNCRKSFYPPKRKEQFYIQTWHGGIALKKIEKDAQNALDEEYLKIAKNDSQMADLFISNSRFCSEMYRSAFWYNGEIYECGTPRCDILINNDNKEIETIKIKLGIDKNTKILLYAPTFRTDSNTKVYDIEYNILINTLQSKFGSKWIILVRLHPNISLKDNFMNYNLNIINVTNYPDMYELLLISDILITDYSSTMFEFSLTQKPVFLYAVDIEQYSNDRGFYFNIFSLPYPLAENNQQLMRSIEQFDNSNYLIELEELYNKLDIKEFGKSSKNITELIKQNIRS